MGVPNSQLTTIFLANSQLTTNFAWLAINFRSLSYSEYYSVITQIFFTSARQSLLGVGPDKIKV